MSTQVQFRRGTTAQTASFTGVTAEITVDTTKNTVVVHDGSTAGGFALARESAVTSNAASVTAAFNTANGAFAQANAAFTVANNALTSSNGSIIWATANAAFEAANSDLYSQATANAAFLQANAAFTVANSAFTSSNGTIAWATANSAGSYANSAFDSANSAGSYANSAFAAANAATATDTTQNNSITAAFASANAAFTRANNSLNANTGGSITGDVVITGNLTIQGQQTYANTQTVLIADNIITVNAAIDQTSAPTVNAGIEVDRGSSANTSLLWNESTDKWTATNDGTNYFNLASDAAESYANAAFAQANTDYTTISATAGVYGNAAYHPVVTLTANGRVSSITNTAIAISADAVTSGTLAVARGGTGVTTSTGTGAVVLGTAPTITLPVINNIKQGYSTTATAAGTTTLTVNSNYLQFFTGTTTQILSLPAPQTMTLGMAYFVVNNSTGSIEVRASNAAAVATILPGTSVMFVCVDTTAGGGATSWAVEIVGFSTITGTGAVVLNTAPTLSDVTVTGSTVVSGNVTANSVIANNSIYSPVVYSTGALSRLELSDIGLVGITVAGQNYQFGASGLESSPGIFGGSFGGNRLSLNNETNLISNRYDTVKIQTGSDGTTVNDFIFANNTFSAPGKINVETRLDWTGTGYAQPSFTNRSAGQKITLYPAISGSAVDYSIGIDGGALWSTVPVSSNEYSFKWYGGQTQIASLSGVGALDVISANITSSNTSTSNTTGALRVTGGIGVTGNVSADGIIFSDNTRQISAGASIGDAMAMAIALG